ncbi:DUF935 domain-containing protein [Reyranella sp.]|uniref:DUF935 domain-containing protein n=1 Tax=Reyranella sp. TaxID=1929291 RepID=UPI002731707A|nr:DUF935 domain-containing protein [Reyranella sp.]MDP2376541.1 DUF935 domain-containing protein [Reyranella sp.]
MAALLDHLGRPIDTALLKKEIAAPTLSGVRQMISGHPAQGLTPGRLASILRQAESSDPAAYLELAADMEEKDLHYLAVLGTRKRQVAQLEITVEAASDAADDQANADLISSWLLRDDLDDDLFDILDAVGKGFSLCELIWSMSERQWWPERIEYVDPRFVRFDPLTGRVPMLLGDAGLPEDLPPFKFIYHRIRASSGLPIRTGLARPVSWMWMFKNYAVKDWVAFAEVYGMPFRLGRYESGATREDISTLLRALADFGVDAAAAIPKSMDIEFVDGKGASADGALFRGMAEWFDMQISKAVLGQTATTDAVTGGLGSGAEHNDVRGDIERADAKALAATLNRTLVRPMVDLNRGPPRSGVYPRLVVGRASAWDPVAMMPAVESFVRLGGRVEASVISDRLGLPEAGDKAVILSAAGPDVGATGAAPGPAEAAGARQPPPEGPQAASHASQSLSRGGRAPITAAAGPVAGAPAAPPPDPIDRMIDQVVGDGEWIAAPLAATIDDILAQATTLEEARDRIALAASEMDVAAFAERLARAGFAARLAGLTGQTLTDETPEEDRP